MYFSTHRLLCDISIISAIKAVLCCNSKVTHQSKNNSTAAHLKIGLHDILMYFKQEEETAVWLFPRESSPLR